MVRKVCVSVFLCAAATLAGCGDHTDEGDLATMQGSHALPAISGMNAVYYYEDLDAAWQFYTGVLGYSTVADHGFTKILRVGPNSYLTLTDQRQGPPSSYGPKTVTLAVITDEVEGWWEYLMGQAVEMRAPLGEVGGGRPHDGFVAIDPEGYFLEFERFNPHPENEALLPLLRSTPPLYPDASAPGVGSRSTRPVNLGVRGTVLWLYYEDLHGAEAFYQGLLGVETVVDQGWAKVLPASPTGFVGLVDGERGLHRATEDKAVSVSFMTDDLEDWLDHAGTVGSLVLETPNPILEGEFLRTLVGYDPEGYRLRWDDFLEVEGNRELVGKLVPSVGRDPRVDPQAR